MLDAAIKSQLKTYLERLVEPIVITASLDDSDSSKQLLELLEEIKSASPKVTLNTDGSNARTPSFTIAQQGQTPRVTFAGIPVGHEFTSLVLALLQVSGYAPKLPEQTIAQIKDIKEKLNFETYVSLSCHNCPDVVQALNTMAALNSNITNTMIDGALFQPEVEQRNILAVPSVYVNGAPFGQGRMTADDILAKITTVDAASEAAKLADKPVFDVLIIGGGPAGAAAAIYAARKGIKTGVVAERFGGQVLDTMAIENYISISQTMGPQFGADLEKHVNDYDVDIMNRQTAVKIHQSTDTDGTNKDGTNKDDKIATPLIEVELENGAILKAKTVILATGARWREMGVTGEQEYRGKGIAYCPHCDGPLFKGKKVAVVGGGNSGVEAAIDLAGLASEVTLLEFDTQLRADAILQTKLNRLPNASVLTNVKTTQVLGDGNKMNGLTYTHRDSGEAKTLDVDGTFVQIGLVPNTDWLKGEVDLSPRGEIIINERNETSMIGVFAAGDATTVPYKQIIIAAGEGSKAALSAFDYLIRNS